MALRFPAARDVDQRQYQARLDFLAQDTCHIAVPLLRAACDRVARDAKGLPYASEILAAAAAIVAERQRVHDTAQQPAYGATPAAGDKAAAYRRANVLALQQGYRVMQTDMGELFMLGDRGERRGIRSDGSAIEPWFHHSTGPDDTVPIGWYCRQEDAAELARCYAQYGSQYAMHGAKIVEAA